ncbi:MAG: site-2 protease family protein [Thermoplasmata archaeon]
MWNDEYGANTYRVTYVVKQGKINNKDEIKNILIASSVLFLDFVIISYIYHSSYIGANLYLGWVLFAGLAVLTGFFLHEMAHRYLAIKYGCDAEFKYYPLFLFISIVTSFLGVIFAAPGAVYISGYLTKKENGQVSLAGPMTNLFFGIMFFAIAIPVHLYLFMALATLNSFFALFNLVPIPPLDGSKVFSWNKIYWGISIGVSAILFLLTITI